MNVDMKTTKKQQRAEATPGFAIELLPDTELGCAMLIVEDEDGQYEPIALAVSIKDGKALAQIDFSNRMRAVESRTEADVLCPYEYKLWARGIDGHQQVAATWLATEV